MGKPNKPPECFGIETPPPDQELQGENVENIIVDDLLAEGPAQGVVEEVMEAMAELDPDITAKPKKPKKVSDKGPDGYLAAVYGKPGDG